MIRLGDSVSRAGASSVPVKLAGLALAAVLALLAVSAEAGAQAGGESRRVIIELDRQATAAALPEQAGARSGRAAERVAAYRSELRAAQRQMLQRARGAGIRARELAAYTFAFDGIAAEVAAPEVAKLKELPGVVGVHPDLPVHASVDVSVPLVGAPEVWESRDESGTPVRGRGVTVAVIDTGVDYGHPDLGGGFGPGHKVAAGYDFVNNDADPADDNGHGTHVAGIIAGEGNVTGVAPEATLTAYKVLDAGGDGYESDVLAGLEAAVNPSGSYPADVVNMSLGAPGDGTDPVGRAASALAATGVVVVAAAGNGGPARHSIGSPAAAPGVVAVGASTSGVRVPSLTMVTPEHVPLQAFRTGISANPPDEPLTAEVVDVGEGRPEDIEGVDVRGKVVLLQLVWDLGPILELERRGAAAAVLYTPLPPITDDGGGIGIGEPGVEVVPHGLASGDNGRLDRLVVLSMDGYQHAELSRFLARGSVEVVLEGRDSTDELASFSSRGPSERFLLKPELVAPGVEIRSTVPRSLLESGEYRLSGTSMAAPHVAGAAALLRQLRRDEPGDVVAARLIGTAKPLAAGASIEQGAGRLDVAAAARTTVTADPSALSLGLADLSRPSVGARGRIAFSNHGTEPLQLELSGHPAGASAGDVAVAPGSLTVPAGGTADVEVTVTGPRPEEHAAAYSGWVVADAPNGLPDIRVPYLLAAEPLEVHTSPDPSEGVSEVFVYSPTELAGAPEVVVTDRQGRETSVQAEFDHARWWRASVSAPKAGTYTVTARARATEAGSNAVLVGGATLEVLADDQRGTNGARWEPVGPNSDSGEIVVARRGAGREQLAVTTFGDPSVWLSDDGATSWRQSGRFPVAGGSGRLVVDPTNGRRMWYALNSGLVDPTYRGRILRSTDAGAHWSVLPFPDTEINALVRDEASGLLLAVTDDGMYLSRDDGDTWEAHAVPWPQPTNDIRMIGGDVFAATYEGLYVVRGVAAGESGPAELVFRAPGWWAAVFQVLGDERLILTSTFSDGLFASRDGGRTWTAFYNPPSRAVTTTMEGDDILVASYWSNYVSHDRGATWAEWPDPNPNSIETDFAPAGPRGPGWLVSAEGAGLYATSDEGRTYRRVGIQGVTVNDLAVARAGAVQQLLAGTNSEVYGRPLPTGPIGPETAEWGESGFEASFGASVRQIAASPADPSVVWKIRTDAVDQFRVYRSDDGGSTWDLKAATFEVPLSLHVHPADPERVYIGFWSLVGAGLLVTTDGGATWKKLFHEAPFEAIAGDPRNADRLWLGNRQGLWRSDDGGLTVTKVAAEPISAISIDPRRPERIVAGGRTILVSTDGGNSFREAESGGLAMRVSDLVVSPRDPETLYAGTVSHYEAGLIKSGRGVLRSVDGGRTWENVSGGLQNLSVTSLALSTDGEWLFAGTTEGGVHRLQLRH